MSKIEFPKNIIIFGVGGGGARTLAELPSFIFEAVGRDLCSYNLEKQPTVWIVDHDYVEPRNCFRQPYQPWDVNELKAVVMKSRFQNLLNIRAIPEAANVDTLPKIFTEEILNQPFCVISKLDHPISTSQIYKWVLENTPNHTDWAWFFSGTALKTQKVKGTFREVNREIKLPYVTAYMYGKIKGQPIVPDLTDKRFLGVSPKPFPVHIAHQDVIVDTTGIRGRQSDGGGCGMGDGDRAEQASLGNLSSTLMTMRQMHSLYMQDVVIPEIIETDYTQQALFPYTLDEVFNPEEYPELQQLLTENQDEQTDTRADSSEPRPESSNPEEDGSD